MSGRVKVTIVGYVAATDEELARYGAGTSNGVADYLQRRFDENREVNEFFEILEDVEVTVSPDPGPIVHGTRVEFVFIDEKKIGKVTRVNLNKTHAEIEFTHAGRSAKTIRKLEDLVRVDS